MLKVQYRKKGIKLAHIYFYGDDYSNLKNDIKGADIVFMHGCYTNPVGGVLYTHQNTLIKDLNAPEDELFLSFGKHLRQYIKRSQKDENVRVEFYQGNAITEEVLKNAKRLYEKMFLDKGRKAEFNTTLAKRYKEQKSLIIGAAFENDEMIGYSAVITDENNARLWIAAFDFRNEDENSQVLSRTHQRLDWELMLKCKELGITKFDFGGVNSFTDPNGIAQFKMNFEKENKVEYDNYLIPNTLIGKVALKWFLK